MTVRDERPSDATSIRRVVERAFGQVAETNLVERLRLAGAASISLVVVKDPDGARAEWDEVVGHILFSPHAQQKLAVSTNSFSQLMQYMTSVRLRRRTVRS